MFRYTFYDVLDNNKPVLVDAKHSEVCAFLGVKTFSFVNNRPSVNLYRGRYEVVRKSNESEMKSPLAYSEDFRMKWEKECEWYRNFNWRKTWSKGAKRLVPGGKR